MDAKVQIKAHSSRLSKLSNPYHRGPFKRGEQDAGRENARDTCRQTRRRSSCFEVEDEDAVTLVAFEPSACTLARRRPGCIREIWLLHAAANTTSLERTIPSSKTPVSNPAERRTRSQKWPRPVRSIRCC
eukprot:9499771-Pyramimonas_sp.AAC.2